MNCKKNDDIPYRRSTFVSVLPLAVAPAQRPVPLLLLKAPQQSSAATSEAAPAESAAETTGSGKVTVYMPSPQDWRINWQKAFYR